MSGISDSLFGRLKQRFAWQRNPIVRKKGTYLKTTRTRNGTGIVRVKDCPICGKTFRLQPGAGRLVKHGARYGSPTNQCGAHMQMKKKPKEKTLRRRKKK